LAGLISGLKEVWFCCEEWVEEAAEDRRSMPLMGEFTGVDSTDEIPVRAAGTDALRHASVPFWGDVACEVPPPDDLPVEFTEVAEVADTRR
jgi:hypothetical protein